MALRMNTLTEHGAALAREMAVNQARAERVNAALAGKSVAQSKVSDLVRFALDCGLALDRSEYLADDLRFHEGGSPARVNLAGFVIAALGMPRDADASLLDIDDEDLRYKLFAIDFARLGLVDDAVFATQGYVLSGYPGSSVTDAAVRIRDGFSEYQEDILDKWLWRRDPPGEGIANWNEFDAAIPAFEEMIADLRSVGW